MSIIHAVSRGKVLFLATCNSTAGLSPALMRRFKSGKFFFDLPNAEDRTAIWQHYCDRHGYTECQVQNHPKDEGWSPANIEVCVETASTMGVLIDDAAEYIVPEGQASARSIEALRSQAEGVWISASESGPYRRPKNEVGPSRDINLNFSESHKLN